MFDLKTITPEEVISTYEKTGLRPVSGKWGDGKTCGCVITALAAATLDEKTFDVFLSRISKFSPVYDVLNIDVKDLINFIRGFNDDFPLPERDYNACYDAGKRVREAVEQHFQMDFNDDEPQPNSDFEW